MLTAYCDRSGTIGFTSGKLPSGTLPIARHQNPALLRGTIAAVARHSYEENTQLVPGIPEARNSDAALVALDRFTNRVGERLRSDLAQDTSNRDRMLVPRDGDVAHRKGFKSHDNPFTPGTVPWATWKNDWEFRRNHVVPVEIGTPQEDDARDKVVANPAAASTNDVS